MGRRQLDNGTKAFNSFTMEKALDHPKADRSVRSPANIGERLRQSRIDQNISLVELSKKSGVSFANISKIETGKVSGGFQTIYKIARGLGILVTDIMADEDAQEERLVLQRHAEIEPHRTVLYDYYPQASRIHGRLNPGIMVVHTRDVPSRTDWSNHEGEEVLTVLSGSIDLHCEGQEPLRLEQGDSVCFDSGVAHAYVCTSDQPARIFFVSTRAAGVDPA